MDFDADTASTTSSKVMDAGPDHPVNVAHREWRKLNGTKGFNAEEFDEKHRFALIEFIVAQMDVEFCKHIHTFEKDGAGCKIFPCIYS